MGKRALSGVMSNPDINNFYRNHLKKTPFRCIADRFLFEKNLIQSHIYFKVEIGVFVHLNS